jgi:hypothetical protein
MVNNLLRTIDENTKGFFADILIHSLDAMTEGISNTVMSVSSEAVKGPQEWNGAIFSLVKGLSDNVILPLAGIVITYVLVYELYHMVVDNNNMKSFEASDMVKYLFKAFLAVFVLSRTFDIAMAIFDVAGYVVQSAVGVIDTSAAVSLGDYSTLRDRLMAMQLWEIVSMSVETVAIRLMVWATSIVMMVVLYGRMLEIYFYISVAPLPFAAFGNKELSGMSQNYVKGLVAVAFQGFFIVLVTGIYAKMVSSVYSSGDLHGTMFNVAVSTLVLLFVMLKTGAISKSIFGAH